MFYLSSMNISSPYSWIMTWEFAWFGLRNRLFFWLFAEGFISMFIFLLFHNLLLNRKNQNIWFFEFFFGIFFYINKKLDIQMKETHVLHV